MRLIGHLENEPAARTLSDYLYAEGIENQLEADADGSWALWIDDEDQIATAKGMMDEYRSNPAEPKFRAAGREAGEKREKEAARIEAAQRRTRTGADLFPQVNTSPGWLTVTLVGVCVAISILSLFEGYGWIVRALYISEYIRPTLPEIRHGEVWRLLTPIFVHFGILHLVFNMMWMLDLGTMIERRQGPGLLAMLVVALAIPSNLAEYFATGPSFGGMSGVVYGLIGYIWMRGKFDPASGLFLHSSTVTMAVVWYFLCLAKVIPNVANTVHTVGFAVGLAWGFLSAQLATRRLR